jgi:hypothetical protein
LVANSRLAQIACRAAPEVKRMSLQKRPRVGPHDAEGDMMQWLLHTGGVSNSGLKGILSKLNAAYDGLDLPTNDHTIHKSFMAKFNEIHTQIRLPLADGGEHAWHLLHPGRLVASMIRWCPVLEDAFVDAVERSPPTISEPWSLIVGFDEFTPGNKLRVDNNRKCMNLSFSFLQLGQELLASDLAWFTPVCMQSHTIALLEGGWPHALREYLKLQLLGTDGLSSAGLPLELRGQHVLLFARLTNILSDGDGFRLAYDWKASASFKPCLRHWNVVKKDEGAIRPQLRIF